MCVCYCALSQIWECIIQTFLHPADVSGFTSPWVDVFERLHESFQGRSIVAYTSSMLHVLSSLHLQNVFALFCPLERLSHFEKWDKSYKIPFLLFYSFREIKKSPHTSYQMLLYFLSAIHQLHDNDLS